mmetsp:Transcript_12585/g.18348  ORF Transcript_12585/g.18348 Transcript_12585/m.18348 type:complete len:246 (-) Transcript_12585:121-858(-)|eukprot:CAMPEP_0197246976 /NCGR_PEP_ID=MMETSP1429-20130617/24844_1 /TAXON_ID=49237 /ORGANISM="Chaetoceros  sp., Strain UNC1202" /LENGTH=245 /DNA_ID=CAMNT_0042707775 /DNA_START=35 /DNA_END=772 /DNA_ORIENTATION=+
MTKFLSTILLLANLAVPCLSSLSVTLAPTEEFCIAFRTPKTGATHFSGSFDVMSELSANPVTVVLFDYETEKVVWHSTYGKSEGSFSATIAGKFHYCFGNGAGGYMLEEDKERKHRGGPEEDDDVHEDYTNTDGELRTIGFTLRLKPVEGTEAAKLQTAKTESENAADDQKKKLMELSDKLIEKMYLLGDHQEFIKNREASHRHVVEETFTLVMKWTVFEALVLVIVATGQVTYLKRFFETKRHL